MSNSFETLTVFLFLLLMRMQYCLLWYLFFSRFLRINLPPGGHPTAVVFGDVVTSYVVACEALVGSSLYMYGEEKPKPPADAKQQAKLPLPEMKWQQHKVHDKRAIITLSRTSATYGNADGSTIIASCSEGNCCFFADNLLMLIYFHIFSGLLI